ncbi:MAG TPA: hypothetical protein VEG29_03730, partial [Candidatus Binatia bacterium]|nr:hypothetical protein [Candidatus Binatia bacterium]
MSTRPSNGSAGASRANVVVGLPDGEHEPVVEELLGAGFGVFEARSAADLAALSTIRDRFDLVVLDAERAEEDTIAALKKLRQARDHIVVLFVTSSESLGAI